MRFNQTTSPQPIFYYHFLTPVEYDKIINMRKITSTKDSLVDYLVAMLSSGKNIKRYHEIIRKREVSRYKKESISVALSRLNKKGYLKKSKGGWSLTPSGKVYYNKTMLLSYIESPFNKNSEIKTIVSFDIPGPQRHMRDWLRNQLKIFGYKMIQQSLWVGPGPLPKEFLKRLKELKIHENIKVFTLNREYKH